MFPQLPGCISEAQPDGFGNWIIYLDTETPHRRMWVAGADYVSYADRHRG